MSISKEKGQYFQEKWEEMEYRFANIEMKKEIERLKIIEEKYKDSQLYIKDFKDEIERLNNIKQKAINELFDLKDMIYKPETREINFDIQRKISSIIKILGSDKE